MDGRVNQNVNIFTDLMWGQVVVHLDGTVLSERFCELVPCTVLETSLMWHVF
jgi:hypothetical protein